METTPTSQIHRGARVARDPRPPQRPQRLVRSACCATLSLALLAATTVAQAAVDIGRAKALLSQNACLGCHSVSSRLVGPSYHEVGAKYKGGDPATLAARIRSGGTGKWGQLEMPPQTNLSEADAKVLAEWILAGSPDQ